MGIFYNNNGLSLQTSISHKEVFKAKILNNQFSSVFTLEQPGPLHDKGPSPYPNMPHISISTAGIHRSLSNLKPQKTAGPDSIPPTVLKELSRQISPILIILFNISLQNGHVPDDWKEAHVAPVFKKGDKQNPNNYRPVSLTCIIGKCMEHILVSNIMKHLDSNQIIHALQHGFRRNYSCETQLLSLFQDLANNPSQTDLLIMDFSKAFDKCTTLRVGRARHQIILTCTLHYQPLLSTKSAKYLGITLNADLKWNKHINNIARKANNTLGILRRNLRLNSHPIKTRAYQALVRPHLKYASAVWDPHTQNNIHKLEIV